MKTLPEIRVRNAQRKTRLDLKRLEDFAERAFEACGRLPGAELEQVLALPEISVVLVSDRRMASLHHQFMKIAGPTDVLTFHHGEIVISVETARENAREFGSTVEYEIRLYLVHGFLHLLGFDDITASQSQAMAEVQDRVLSALSTGDGGRFLRSRRLN